MILFIFCLKKLLLWNNTYLQIYNIIMNKPNVRHSNNCI